MTLETIAKSIIPRSARRKIRELVRDLRVKELRSVDELDAELAQAEAAFLLGEEAGRKALASFRLRFPRNLPADPHSEAYRQAQFALYQMISGRTDYAVENELTPFDLPQALKSPFPHQTGSAQVVGEQLLAQGFLFQSFPLNPPARVLEFGPGWGNTTLHLLQLGYQVTAVEIDPKFIALIESRAADFKDRLSLVHSDMLTFSSEKQFDAILFFESFHHCADHVEMLRRVKRWVRPGGWLVLASEPISNFPYPWGVRLDGLSLWSMRRYGWLELGFNSAYLLGLLEQQGWSVERKQQPALGAIADVILARRES